ncbi:DNA polymerase III subunit alpha, partial [Alcaligenes faecalis subsp. faecalis NCIB 8687]
MLKAVTEWNRAPLARLEASRSAQWFAGVLSAVRVRMTRRGKMLYAMLD